MQGYGNHVERPLARPNLNLLSNRYFNQAVRTAKTHRLLLTVSEVTHVFIYVTS